ncbi:MAG: fuconate dehydratase [Hyphomicrobiales bacterium]|nr:fuconate dehydratase [Hyphomicrobiales bacterium]
MAHSGIRITEVQVDDVRVPTSDSLLGSDPFHRKPDYSAAIVRIKSNSEHVGWSVVFSIGAGTDWLVYGLKDLSVLLVGRELDEFIHQPGHFHQRLMEHHQLRWLADGVYRMVVGGLVNGLWDLWAKSEGKPLWALLTDLPIETILASIDWRYLRDALTPEEARGILERGQQDLGQRRDQMVQKGPLAYSTSGWLGLSDDQVRAGVNGLMATGLRHFKAKVGSDLEDDRRRLALLRDIIGDDGHLMTDANQIWGVDEAIEWMSALSEFRPFWIEEPTARDDVQGFVRIASEMEPLGIGVAAGEQIPSPVIFKQMLASGALTHCQIDATRLAGVNDVMAVILMAAKFKVPVCPHGGGIGLCNMIRHYAIWDQVAVAATRDNRIVEYIDFLQEGVFQTPLQIRDGHYVTPQSPGWGLEMDEGFIERHRFPTGALWRDRPGPTGPAFEA